MTEFNYICKECDAEVIIDDEGCIYCEDTLCPACCVDRGVICLSV